MEQKINCCILEKEDTITIGAGVTLSSIAGSGLLKQEAKPLFAAAAILADGENSHRYAYGQSTIYEEALQDICCGFTGTPIPCIKEGGTECFALWRDSCPCSVMGGKAVGSPSCAAACPAGMEIPAVLEQLRDNDRLEAQRIVMKYNPMPSVTCRICKQCESACVRSSHDRGVAVSGILQALGDEIGAHPEIFYAIPSGNSRKKIAIKGCGPAGVSAAFYLRKLGNQVCVLEQVSEAQLIEGYNKKIPDFPAKEFAGYIHALADMGVLFKFSVENTELPKDDFDRMIEGKTEPVSSALDFLREVRSGYETANSINLEFGLKSYIKPSKTFIGFDREGAGREVPIWSSSETEGTKWELVSTEAARCLNCGCYGVNESCFQAVLIALEAEIKTNMRNRRALDFFSTTEPLKRLELGEFIQEFEIPKAGAYTSGYLYSSHHVGLVFAYAVQNEKIRDVRLVYSGIAPVPVRMIEVEAYLRGKIICRETRERAAGLVCREAILIDKNQDKMLEMKKLILASFERNKN